MKLRLLPLLITLLIGVGTGVVAQESQDFSFTGLALKDKLNWNNADNWNKHSLPGPDDNVFIGDNLPGGVVNGYEVQIPSAVIVKNLTLVSSSLSGAGVTVTGDLELEVSSIGPGGPIIVNGAVDVIPVPDDPAAGESQLSSDLTCTGTITVSQGASLVLMNGPLTLTSKGMFNLEANAKLIARGNTGLNFRNLGTFTAGAGSAISGFGSLGQFVNAGVLKVPSGQLTMTGSPTAAFVSSGEFFADANGVISVDGAIALQGGASFTGAGKIALSTVTASDTVSVRGTVEFGGSWIETGQLNIEAGGVFIWLAGTIRGDLSGTANGQVINSGQLTIGGANGDDLQLLKADIHNKSTIFWRNGDLSLGNTAAIDNQKGALFDVRCDANLATTGVGGNSTASFSNGGEFRKTTGNAAAWTGIALSFTGRVNSKISVQQGVLKFFTGSDGVLVTSTVEVGTGAASPASIEFVGATQTHAETTFVVAAASQITVSAGVLNWNGVTIQGGGRFAVTGAARVNVDRDALMSTSVSGTFELSSGTIAVAQNVTLQVAADGTFEWTGGTLAGRGSTDCYGDVNISGDAPKYLVDQTLRFYNSATWSGGGAIIGSNTGDASGPVIDNNGTFEIQNDRRLTAAKFFNPGTIKKTGAGDDTSFACAFENVGTIQVASGTITMLETYTDRDGFGTGRVVLEGAGIRFNLPLVIDGDFTGSGLVEAPAIENDGSLSFLTADLAAQVVNNHADMELGDDPGVSQVHGDFNQSATAVLVAPLRGTNAAAPDFGQLLVSGKATLGGTLRVPIEAGFAPGLGLRFQIVSAASVKGTFDKLDIPAGISVEYATNGVFLNITGVVPVQVISPGLQGTDFGLSFHTIQGRNYTILFSDDLTGANWTPVKTFVGDGSPYLFSAPVAARAHGFYQVSEP